jgi:hypothetical protein
VSLEWWICRRGEADGGSERTKTRIVQAPGVASAALNPYLLSAAEERDVVKKQADLRAGLRVPRR